MENPNFSLASNDYFWYTILAQNGGITYYSLLERNKVAKTKEPIIDTEGLKERFRDFLTNKGDMILQLRSNKKELEKSLKETDILLESLTGENIKLKSPRTHRVSKNGSPKTKTKGGVPGKNTLARKILGVMSTGAESTIASLEHTLMRNGWKTTSKAPRSIISVALRQHSNFFKRVAAGKYKLTVSGMKVANQKA